MEITYESICEKLGFRPGIDKYDYKYNGHEDDSQESPYSKLSLEESLFLADYFKTQREKNNNTN